MSMLDDSGQLKAKAIVGLALLFFGIGSGIYSIRGVTGQDYDAEVRRGPVTGEAAHRQGWAYLVGGLLCVSLGGYLIFRCYREDLE